MIRIDDSTGKITVRVNDKNYACLSAAAFDVSGGSHNGRVYWGLKNGPSTRRRCDGKGDDGRP